MTFRGVVLLASFALSGLAQIPDAGKREYQARCVGCHGEDGSGGGHGPGILAGRIRSRQAVSDVIRNGIPGTAMPAFSVGAAELGAVADYVVKLKTTPEDASAVTGDAARGARMFGEKCTGCHMVRGRGGVLGPDLSVAGQRSTAVLRAQLAKPGGVSVTVTLRDGRVVKGVAKNRSPFDVQLLGADGRLHLLGRELIASEKDGPSLMPPVSEGREDLVAYLKTLKQEPGVVVGAMVGQGITFAEIAKPRAGEWPSYNGTLDGNRYSPLTQIDRGNVGGLAPRWMFPIAGAPGALQTTPVVVDGVMFVPSVNEAFALDARNGREIWHYKRPRTKGLAGDAASGINRGVAVLGDRVFMATDDARLIALHRATGQLIWDVEMADYRENYGATGAPLVVGDLVVAGISGGDEGVRGFLDAYKASTGERVWRFWTIPARGEKGAETWVGRALEHGCGTTWLTGTYDAASGTLYWPTGNPCPDYNGDERKGDNLYTDSVVALDAKTGRLRWHYQFTPHDLHDWDATEPPVLVDFAGRKLLVQGNRNGFFYTLDRETGKVLRAEPFVKKLTWASGIGSDGRPVLLPGHAPTEEGQRTCPSVAGAANWTSTAFAPGTGLYYFFAQESCNIYSKNGEWWKAGESFYGGGTRRSPGDDGGKFLKAIDLRTGKAAWEIPNIGGGILGSGLMATGGGLLFYGDGRGAFVAADSSTGKLLWHFNTGQAWKSGPMTYTVDGKQYVAIAAGTTIVSFGLR